MSSLVDSRHNDTTVQITPDEDARYIGLVTRAISWILDAVVINVAAIGTGVGVGLVLSIFPLSKDLKPSLEAIAATAYVVWAAFYFIAFWSITGQTVGARIMQIRLVTPGGKKPKAVRSLVRWVGMNLAMIPLFAGYWPILFRRRGFPDWLAHTLVVDAEQESVAAARSATLRATQAPANDGLARSSHEPGATELSPRSGG